MTSLFLSLSATLTMCPKEGITLMLMLLNETARTRLRRWCSGMTWDQLISIIINIKIKYIADLSQTPCNHNTELIIRFSLQLLKRNRLSCNESLSHRSNIARLSRIYSFSSSSLHEPARICLHTLYITGYLIASTLLFGICCLSIDILGGNLHSFHDYILCIQLPSCCSGLGKSGNTHISKPHICNHHNFCNFLSSKCHYLTKMAESITSISSLLLFYSQGWYFWHSYYWSGYNQCCTACKQLFSHLRRKDSV